MVYADKLNWQGIRTVISAIICFWIALYCLVFFYIFRRQRECYYGETFMASSNKVEEHCKQLQSLGFSGKGDQVCVFESFKNVLLWMYNRIFRVS